MLICKQKLTDQKRHIYRSNGNKKSQNFNILLLLNKFCFVNAQITITYNCANLQINQIILKYNLNSLNKFIFLKVFVIERVNIDNVFFLEKCSSGEFMIENINVY